MEEAWGRSTKKLRERLEEVIASQSSLAERQREMGMAEQRMDIGVKVSSHLQVHLTAYMTGIKEGKSFDLNESSVVLIGEAINARLDSRQLFMVLEIFWDHIWHDLTTLFNCNVTSRTPTWSCFPIIFLLGFACPY